MVTELPLSTIGVAKELDNLHVHVRLLAFQLSPIICRHHDYGNEFHSTQLMPPDIIALETRVQSLKVVMAILKHE